MRRMPGKHATNSQGILSVDAQLTLLFGWSLFTHTRVGLSINSGTPNHPAVKDLSGSTNALTNTHIR